MKRLIVSLVVLLCASFAAAQELRPLPPLLHTVSDEVGVLSADRTAVRVIVVIAGTTKPEEIEDYTQRLGQRWKRERNLIPERSIFVVLSVQDREFQVMPGKGLEFVEQELKKPEAYAGLAPLFRQGRYFEALMTVNRRLLEMIQKHKNRTSRLVPEPVRLSNSGTRAA